MKLFEPIRDSIARTDPVVKLLQREGVKNHAIWLMAQIVILLITISTPTLVDTYNHRFTSKPLSLFQPYGWSFSSLHQGNNYFFWLSIYSGLLFFLTMPTIASIITSSLSARLSQSQSYDLIRVTPLKGNYRVIGILRAALEQLWLFAILAIGLLIAYLVGTLSLGSIIGFFTPYTSINCPIVPQIYRNPLPGVCLVISLIGITLLSSATGIAASAKFRSTILPNIVTGIGSAISTLLLCWVYHTTMFASCQVVYDFFNKWGVFCIDLTIFPACIVMVVTPFWLAYGTFQLAERWA